MFPLFFAVILIMLINVLSFQVTFVNVSVCGTSGFGRVMLFFELVKGNTNAYFTLTC